jgi:hypothetical protein
LYFCFYFKTCGGSGTGFTCRALEQMRSCDSKAVNYAVCVAPSPTINGNPLETYNTIAYMGYTRFDNLAMNMHTIYDSNFPFFSLFFPYPGLRLRLSRSYFCKTPQSKENL